MAHQGSSHNRANLASSQQSKSQSSSCQNTAQKQRTEPHQDQQQTSMKLKADYRSRGLDICHFCGLKYNVGARIPRIIVGCGHTFCTSCLSYFLRSSKIRCPICRKMLKGVESVDRLPLNFNILYETVTQDPLLAVVNFEKCLSGDVDLSQDEEIFPYLCQEHDQRIKHFYCSEHPSIFCRECIKDLHNLEKCFVVDLYEIEKMRKLQLQNMEFNSRQISARSTTKEGEEFPESYVVHPVLPEFKDPFKQEILLRQQRDNGLQQRNNQSNAYNEQQHQQQQQQILEQKRQQYAQYQAMQQQHAQQQQQQNNQESSSEAPLTSSEMNTAEKQRLKRELMLMGYDDEDDEDDEEIEVDEADDDEDFEGQEEDNNGRMSMKQAASNANNQLSQAERFAQDKRLFAAQLKQELLYGKQQPGGGSAGQSSGKQQHVHGDVKRSSMHGGAAENEDDQAYDEYDEEDIEYADEQIVEGENDFESAGELEDNQQVFGLGGSAKK